MPVIVRHLDGKNIYDLPFSPLIALKGNRREREIGICKCGATPTLTSIGLHRGLICPGLYKLTTIT